MRKITLLFAAACVFFGTAAFARPFTGHSQTPFDYSFLWSGSWEGKTLLTGNLHNRAEVKLSVLPLGLLLRGQALDRRPLNFEFEPGVNWLSLQDFDKAVYHFQGGIYHQKTGSRILIGSLDEWGLAARIRNPWIRSAPYAENHKPLITDFKTSVSGTKEDEAYAYLSTPYLNFSPNIRGRVFVSAQAEIGIEVKEYRQSAASAGIDLVLPDKSSLLFESFFTYALLPPTKNSAWFSTPSPLPERDYNLKAAGFLYTNPLLAISGDFALSESFAYGSDIYANLGVSVYPKVSFGYFKTMLVSLAFDGAGSHFVYRDGADHGAGFRCAAKIELKGSHSSLLRLSTILRAPEVPFVNGGILGSSAWGFNRSSTNFYWRLPSSSFGTAVFRVSRISVSLDRNAVNPLKITDRLYGYIGFSLNLSHFNLNTPIGIVFNGSIRGLTAAEGGFSPFPAPIPQSDGLFWNFEDCAFYSELAFSPSNYQFKTRVGFSNNAKNEKIWDFSASGAVRFKNGRLSLKIASPQLPDRWNFNISWRLEVK